VLAACGGGGDSSADVATSDGDESAAPTVEATPDDITVEPTSEIETNILPDVVVDNLILNNKANLRNVIPSDKVVLLWMWAPF